VPTCRGSPNRCLSASVRFLWHLLLRRTIGAGLVVTALTTTRFAVTTRSLSGAASGFGDTWVKRMRCGPVRTASPRRLGAPMRSIACPLLARSKPWPRPGGGSRVSRAILRCGDFCHREARDDQLELPIRASPEQIRVGHVCRGTGSGQGEEELLHGLEVH
jgi:hypothetical protein